MHAHPQKHYVHHPQHVPLPGCLAVLLQAALARMTLHDHFQCMVTAEDELDTISQRLLTASIKLGRAPNFCVYFDSSPRGITAAHNCTLKAVAVQVSLWG